MSEEAMNPERGPLPPKPAPMPDYPMRGEDCWTSASMDAYAIAYAAAEVARLAGQAVTAEVVAWQWRMSWDNPKRQWLVATSQENLDSLIAAYGRDALEIRALGVIATPSADSADAGASDA